MDGKNILVYILTALLVFVLTVLILKWLIPKLKSHKLGQKILDIGPRWHKSKEGTPTMGGISFMAAICTAAVLFIIYFAVKGESGMLIRAALILELALTNGIIGLIDDYTKFIKKRNEGLTASQKYILQLVSAGIFIYLLTLTGNLDTTLYIPYFKAEIELGWFYIIFAVIFITGIVNSVNLTDGIDGLASSVTFMASLFFLAVGIYCKDTAVGAWSAALIGGTAGFLVYNFYPARVFMGDTGSLFLGGAVTALGFMIMDPLILIIVGIIYIAEALSDILQVGYFKLTHGKRLFKMAPIHHHFEKCGWSEIKIVTVFSAVTLICSCLAFLDFLI